MSRSAPLRPRRRSADALEEIDDTAVGAQELTDEVAQPSEEAMAAQDAMQAEASTGAEMAAEPGGWSRPAAWSRSESRWDRR